MMIVPVPFTGEEGGGRFLDLHNIYNIYTNLPQYQKKVKPYVMYISSFQQDLSRVRIMHHYVDV